MGRSLWIPRLKPIVVAVVYIAAWMGSDLLGRLYNNQHGTFYPWFLGAAMTFYLVDTFGLAYAPLAIVAELVRPVLFPATMHFPLIVYVEFGTVAAVGYSLASIVLRRWLRVRTPFATFHDAANFCGVAILAPLLMALIPAAIALHYTDRGWHDYIREVINFWVGDTLGLLVLVPILATYLTGRVAPERIDTTITEAPFDVPLRERLLLYATLVGATLLGYAAVMSRVSEDPLRYFLFLPLIWMAARGGLRLAIPGILVTDFLTSTLNFFLPSTRVNPVDLQSFIVISAIASLSIGALVDQRARAESETRALAFSNALTGLPNRRGLERWLARASERVMLAVVDVDHMKLTNDGLTRAMGDELLKQIALRCRDFHGANFVSHISADEFVIALLGNDWEPEEFGRRIVALFDEPIAVSEHEIYISVSVGVAQSDKREEFEQLIRHADLAMYRAKQLGRGRTAIYVESMSNDDRQLSLATELHRAVRMREFALFYQPIFEFVGENLRCTGVEALLRWNHPTLGLLEPDSFITFLENMTLADRVGTWVLDEAARQSRIWLDAGLDLQTWINLFPRQALDPKLPEHLTAILQEYGVSPARIVLEILERVIAEDENDIGRAVRALRALGTLTAIDDFGTGHSSLARLRELPVDVVKVDRTFVTRCEIDDKASSMVQGVLHIAKELRLRTLAEGIENEEQLDRLRFYGCRYVQGYYLARPMPAENVIGWLSAAHV
ncbi:MAG TPA: EAL domain-containing protein [Candidatus Dormibacteraeota bacterium]|nr:EAL domain-containing protein [Candidatus Dormibacteraeota bacterium]